MKTEDDLPPLVAAAVALAQSSRWRRRKQNKNAVVALCCWGCSFVAVR